MPQVTSCVMCSLACMHAYLPTYLLALMSTYLSSFLAGWLAGCQDVVHFNVPSLSMCSAFQYTTTLFYTVSCPVLSLLHLNPPYHSSSSITHLHFLLHHTILGNDQAVICRNIVGGKLLFPRSFNPECKPLVEKLLIRETQNRLGKQADVICCVFCSAMQCLALSCPILSCSCSSFFITPFLMFYVISYFILSYLLFQSLVIPYSYVVSSLMLCCLPFKTPLSKSLFWSHTYTTLSCLPGTLRGGADDIVKHPWFAKIDFNAYLYRKVKGKSQINVIMVGS